MLRRVLPLVVVAFTAACGNDAPPAPTPVPTEQTRIIAITGELNFGDVELFSDEVRTVSIQNQGNAVMTVADVYGPPGGAFTASWRSGTIAAGATQLVSVTFQPAERRSYDGSSLTVNANFTSGIHTRPIFGSGVLRTPLTRFGQGQWRVNSEIAPGRYFSAAGDGCYWERQKGFSGELSDVIANDFILGVFGQVIVDVLSSDLAFEGAEDCGTWQSSPVRGHEATISPGNWLVGAQVSAGTYTADVRDGCYWERQRNFQGTTSSVIANDFADTGGARSVTIRSSDVGFYTDDDCGTWTRTGSVGQHSLDEDSSLSSIEGNRRRARDKKGDQRLR